MGKNRLEVIKRLLSETGEISLSQLENIFPDCSTMTLRRDLIRLENEGIAKRIRGGAVLASRLFSHSEDVYCQRARENVGGKNIIAEKAVKFLSPQNAYYIDAGSTAMFFAKAIPDDYYTFVTSGANIALELINKTKPSVTLVGGQMNYNTLSLSGSQSIEFMRNVNIDTAFIATSGFTLENGFSGGTLAESELKHAIIQKARRTIIMMDFQKIGKSMLYTFARLEDIDVLITDVPLPAQIQAAAEQAGVIVV